MRDIGDASHGSEGTILVVDDDAAIRELYVDILQSANFEVVAAEDGRRAVDLFAARSAAFDLIVLDWAMPNMHGRECLDAILQIAPETAVIVASGYHPNDPALDIAGLKTSALLTKPFSASVLVDAVRKVIAGVPVEQDERTLFFR